MPFNFEQDAYKALKKTLTERTSSLIAWVGAGLSAQADLPSWAQLIKHLVDVGRRKVAMLSDASKEKGLLQALEEKEASKDYWLAFQLAEELLGKVTYQAEIRQKLDTGAPPPPVFKALWRIGIQGMISFNLDHFAQQSFSAFRPGAKLDTFIGHQAKNLAGVLQRNNHFIGNPHGIIDNASTWIFNQRALQQLLQDAGYRQFVNTCLISRTVIFAGITVDDAAIEEHLKTLNRAEIQGINHYWITHRTDALTDRWSEDLNLRIIRYSAYGRDHGELLECLQELANAAPMKDQNINEPVVFGAVSPAASIPSPDELLNQPLDIIREKLNGHVLIKPAIKYLPKPMLRHKRWSEIGSTA